MKDEELEFDNILELDGEKFEVIDAICYEGCNYIAIIPYSEEEIDSDEPVDFTILKETEGENEDEITLSTVDDDALYEEIGEAFIEHINSMMEECDCEGECDCQ